MRPAVFLLADFGYPPYSEALVVTRKTLGARTDALERFLRASAEGWRSYLANPAPGNALIRQANPADERRAARLRRAQDERIRHRRRAATRASSDLLTMTDARWQATVDFLRGAGLAKPNVDYRRAYTLDLVKIVRVVP